MIAFVFPGQGSQFPGMGRDLSDAHPICRETFAEADDALGFPISRLCFEGPEDQLQLTANAQPAILAASVAALRCLEKTGRRPSLVAGHSLGEYSALVAAGALAFGDALRLVRSRGIYMQEAVPIGQGAMAAILGLDAAELESVCREASEAAKEGGHGVWPANLNAPGQTVVSGASAAVDRAIELARERGARRAVRLAVSAPFHCPMMEPAARRLEADLGRVAFHDPRIPLVSNVDAAPLSDATAARTALARQVTAPVRWEESVKTLARLGATSAYEVGPGKVLSGLIKRISPEIRCVAAGDAASIAALQETEP